MKHKKAAWIVTIALLVILAAAFVSTFFLKNERLEVSKTEYSVFASSYPVYAIGRLIIGDVPGMRLSMLTQPQVYGYEDYALSDWENTLLSKADVLALMGFGFEAFADGLTSEHTAIITLLSMMEMKTAPEDCLVLDYAAEEKAGNSPWLYMSIHGMMDLCEVMYGNMAYLDQAYSQSYYDNLQKAYDLLEPVKQRQEALDALNEKKVAVAHEALLYTAYDLNADIALYIRRVGAQTLNDEQVDECIEVMRQNDISVILFEDTADEAMLNRFREEGITVLALDLMLDRSAQFGYMGYIDAYNHNLDVIEETFRP